MVRVRVKVRVMVRVRFREHGLARTAGSGLCLGLSPN